MRGGGVVGVEAFLPAVALVGDPAGVDAAVEGLRSLLMRGEPLNPSWGRVTWVGMG